jgi:hypothetical protein
MAKQLYQYNYVINGLIPEQVKLKRKVWLKKDELLLEKKGDKLQAYLLGDDRDAFQGEDKITPYLRFSSLISNNAPDLEGCGGVGINSKEELGTKPTLSATISIAYPDEAISDIENYAHKFIRFIGKLHDRYIDVIDQNEFMKIALDYFYEAGKTLSHSSEGFINAVISLEALFNEGPSDIKYKLSHRAAFLLGLCGDNPIEAFEKLKKIYDKRSKLVHGSGTLEYDPDSYLALRYTRRLIIAFLILLKNIKRANTSKHKRKSELLKEIDYAMLHGTIQSSLKNEIDKELKFFELTIPRTFEGTSKMGDYRITVW